MNLFAEIIRVTSLTRDDTLQRYKNQMDVHWTLLMAASTGQKQTISKILCQDRSMIDNCHKLNGANALFMAAQNNKLENVVHLIDSGASINKSITCGRTALHIASQQGHLNIVSCLLERNCNVNISSKSGSTALMSSVVAGYTSIVKLLIANKANVNAKNSQGA